jgi:hypothetical protein
MSETIREKIIKQFMTRMATIQKVNGYNTDIGTNPERVRRHPDHIPASVLYPQPEPNEPDYGTNNLTMLIRIEGIVEYENENPSVISEQILGDLIKAFTDPLWDRRVLIASPASPATYDNPYDNGITYKSGGTDEYPNEEDKTVGAMVIIEVKYATKIGNPYEQ